MQRQGLLTLFTQASSNELPPQERQNKSIKCRQNFEAQLSGDLGNSKVTAGKVNGYHSIFQNFTHVSNKIIRLNRITGL